MNTLLVIVTIVIAYYAYRNYELAKAVTKSSETHQEELKDLFQAIVVATIVSQRVKENSHLKIIEEFNNNYKGEFKFFD